MSITFKSQIIENLEYEYLNSNTLKEDQEINHIVEHTANNQIMIHKKLDHIIISSIVKLNISEEVDSPPEIIRCISMKTNYYFEVNSTLEMNELEDVIESQLLNFCLEKNRDIIRQFSNMDDNFPITLKPITFNT